MCLRVCGSGFCANAAATISLDELLSFLHTLGLSLTFNPVSSFIIYKKCQSYHTHTPTLSRNAHPHSFPGTLGHHFLVLETSEPSDWTVRGDSENIQTVPIRSGGSFLTLPLIYPQSRTVDHPGSTVRNRTRLSEVLLILKFHSRLETRQKPD